ncbi:MAG: hypothetical protein LBB78_00460 [Spirochaetaceae bacterium]|nr:hypothetical protein [Spirochaetaceae bacterium]
MDFVKDFSIRDNLYERIVHTFPIITVNEYGTPYYVETEKERKIRERFKFLDSELAGTENEKQYQETKALLKQILDSLEYRKYPFIGVDDDGQAGAEWHDGEDYKIVTITPLNERKIIINCVKKTFESVIKIQTTLENILKNSNEALRINL